MWRGLRTAFTHLASAVRAVVVALVAVMLSALALQVVMRYVFGQALSWSEELALLCFSWSALLAIALGVRDAVHVRLDLLVAALPGALAHWLDKASALAVAGVGGFIAWAGQNYVVDSFGATSAAIGYPTAWLYACAPVSGALICLFAMEHVVLGPPSQATRAAPATPHKNA
ncbi:MAG: TRAP transporter small permease [Comamonadaceae bacterium]|nr:TRAP transporter small permease [Comamonadaceae bacterium]